ncbi:MAG: hypothetical protein V1916_02370 [Patescibacteria group bacterium]
MTPAEEVELRDLLRKNLVLTEKIFTSMERQRKLRVWVVVLSIVVIVVPLIAAAVSLPWMMKTVQSYYGTGLNL